MTTDRLTRKFDRAIHVSRRRSQVRGRLGRKNDNGSYSMTASDRPGFLYVTLTADGAQTVDIALVSGVPRIYNLPVTMERIGGHLVVTGLDYEGGVLEAFLDGGVAFAPPHVHRTGSGLEQEFQTFWIDAGRVLWSGTAVTVRVRPFHYSYAGVEKYFAGGTLDLTAFLPATAAMWAWVLVCLDPATNALTAVTGAEYAAQVDLTDARIADIDAGFYIPLGAVQAQETDTSLGAISRYRDARHWLDAGGDSFGGVLHEDHADTANGSGSDLDTVNYTVPAGTLAADGDALWVHVWGTTAASTGDLDEPYLEMAASKLFSFAAAGLGPGQDWEFHARIVRTGATTVKAVATLTWLIPVDLGLTEQTTYTRVGSFTPGSHASSAALSFGHFGSQTAGEYTVRGFVVGLQRG